MFEIKNSVKRLILILVIISSVSIYAQPFINQPLTQVTVIPAIEKSNVYFSFRIPYNILVFEKSESEYSAGIRIAVEVTDSNLAFITREIAQKNISEGDFNLTVSREKYLEGVVTLAVPNGKFQLHPVFTDLNSNREIKIPVIPFQTADNETTLLEPVIINRKTELCDNSIYPVLTNFGNNIPFSPDEFEMLIPVSDTAITELSVIAVSRNDTIFSRKITSSYISSIEIAECNKRLFLVHSEITQVTRNFILKDFSNLLFEGRLDILVFADGGVKPDIKYSGNVTWFNKPYSLLKPETAIKALIHIEAEDTIDNLLKSPKDKYYDVLVEYWKRYDPTPDDAFNPLMYEYYSRVDYANENFKPISGKNGSTSDRGKIYIKYGAPQRTERSFDERGKAVEVWHYEKSNRVFRFVDRNGTGEFVLTN